MACASYSDVSSIGKTRSVLSSARPTGADLYIGQLIFETDTKRLLQYDGTGWIILSEPLNTWSTSASWGGISGGGPSYVGDYHRSDGWCDFRCSVTFTSAPTISGLIVILPMTPGYVPHAALAVTAYDNAGTLYLGYNAASVSASVGLAVWTASGTYLTGAGISGAAPFSFGSGDAIEASGRFRMANRYS